VQDEEEKVSQEWLEAHRLITLMHKKRGNYDSDLPASLGNLPDDVYFCLRREVCMEYKKFEKDCKIAHHHRKCYRQLCNRILPPEECTHSFSTLTGLKEDYLKNKDPESQVRYHLDVEQFPYGAVRTQTAMEMLAVYQGVPICAGRKKGKKKMGKKKKPQGKGLYAPPVRGSVTLRSVATAPSTRVPLRQLYNGTLTGAINIATRFNPNAAYQPSVGGPTGTVPGFSEWAAKYGFYRVLAYRTRVRFMNGTAIPARVYCLNTNNDPGTNPGISAEANRLCKTRDLSMAGGQDKATISSLTHVSTVLGSNMIRFDNDYRALINATPADVIWFALGARALDGATNVTVYWSLELIMYVEFFDPLAQ
jgi:hypothetical protein